MAKEVKLDQIKFDRHNANKGSVRGRGQIEASLREFGFADAGTLDRNNVIIGGNKRTEVAGEIGMDEAIIIDVDGTKPVFIRRPDLDLNNPDDDRARRLAYALNRSQEASLTWDAEVLFADMQNGLDLSAFWNQGELDALLEGMNDVDGGAGADTEPQTDKADELRQKWGVELSQLWALGEHRIICGDCTDPATVARVMGGEKAQMMFTDPPYGVDYSGGIQFRKDGTAQTNNRERLEGDADPALYGRFLPVVLPHVDGPCYMWFAGSVGKPVYDAVLGNKCEIHALIIWHKINATYAAMNAQYKQRHEPCLYFKPKKSTLRWCGPTDECTIWEIKRDGQNEFHPTQKPVELAERAMGNHDADLIVDFFLGSGSTLIAAQNKKRRCYGTELNAGYVAVILQRFLDHTGIQPVLID